MISPGYLSSILQNNVVDIRFVRRIQVEGRPTTRRMLCTKSITLLESVNGRMSLNYRSPKGNKQFNEAQNNAVVVWDILMQDFRVVSAESATIIKQIPANDEFWKFYNESLLPMTAEQKLKFMNS